MTQAGVAEIRRHTRGLVYEIVPLDNGSVSDEAEKFIVKRGIFQTRAFCGLSSHSMMRGSIIVRQNYPTKNFCCF